MTVSTKPTQIPLADLSLQHKSIQREIEEAFRRVMASSAFIQGAEVKSFEKEYATYCQAAHCAGVASGTAALELILMALGIGEGDEVVTTPFTFIATAEAVTRVGAKIVFADIEKDTAILDPALALKAVNKRTRAVIPVHLYGQCADMNAYVKMGKDNNVKIIEDAAQAQGAAYNGRRAGSLADAAGFSFYPGKNLGAMGDAGAVTTNDAALANRVRLLADHGRTEKYLHQEPGLNYRLDGLQAAFLRVKLARLEGWNARRRQIAALYSNLLKDSGVKLPVEASGRTHVYHQFVIRTPKRDALRDGLEKLGIGTGIHYPIPLHLQPAYKSLGHKLGDFPVTEEWSREALSLPMFPEMTNEQAHKVCEAVLSLHV